MILYRSWETVIEMHVIFLLQNPSFSNEYGRTSLLLGTVRLFFVRNVHTTLHCIKYEMKVGKKQVGTIREQTHAILNTKFSLL